MRKKDVFYGKGIDIRWDYDENLWRQVNRTLEAISVGNKLFLNHVEALIRLVNISSFIGDRKAKDGSFDDVSRKYEERMWRIDAETADAVKKKPKDEHGILFDAGLRKFNTIMCLLDDRKITPQRQEHAII